MTPVGTQPRPARARAPMATIGLAVIAAALACFALIASSWLRDPAFVPRLTITNPTVYQLEVEVAQPADPAGTGLGAIRRETTRTFDEVADQGDGWVFRFSYGRQDGGELVLGRDELEKAGWRIVVPPEVGDRLRDAGLPPSGR